MHKGLLLGIALAGFTLSALSDADAACTHPPMPWRFGKSFSSTWHTDDKSVCTSTSSHPEHIDKIEIVSKPQHGTAGKNGPFGVAYKPQAGFHGSDAFIYTVTSNSKYRQGAGYVANVTIFVIIE